MPDLITLRNPPPEYTSVESRTDTYHFMYPENGQIIIFDDDDGLHTLRVLVSVDDNLLPFEVEQRSGSDQSAEAAAAEFYRAANPIFDDTDNVPPFSLSIAGHIGWRSRLRFVDGFSAPLVIDAVYVNHHDSLYGLSFSAAPKLYDQARWIFDELVRTFQLI